MNRKIIVSGNSHRADIHKAIEGKTILKIETVVRNEEVQIFFTDGTILKIDSSRENYGGFQCELSECLPAQTKLSFTAWREYRQFDGELVECFEQFFYEFGHEVLESKLTGTDHRYHDWNFWHWKKLQERVIDGIRLGREIGEGSSITQFLLEWDFEGTNQRELKDVLAAVCFWVLACDVSYDAPVLSARVYLLPADQVNAEEKMGRGKAQRAKKD